MGKEPRFYALQATLTDTNPRIWISLTKTKSLSYEDVQIFYDGFVLVEGRRPLGKNLFLMRRMAHMVFGVEHLLQI